MDMTIELGVFVGMLGGGLGNEGAIVEGRDGAFFD